MHLRRGLQRFGFPYDYPRMFVLLKCVFNNKMLAPTEGSTNQTLNMSMPAIAGVSCDPCIGSRPSNDSEAGLFM